MSVRLPCKTAPVAENALSIALITTAWTIGIGLALCVIVTIVLATRAPRSRLPWVLAAIAGLALATTGIVFGILDEDDGPTSRSPTEAPTDVPIGDLTRCTRFFSAGLPTGQIDEPVRCLDNGSETYVFPIIWNCADGRTLIVNDYGWGYRDGLWSTSGEAPFENCRSSADMPCREIFADGTQTRAEWNEGYLECFDDEGKIDYVVTSRWECFDSNEIQLTNRYGWGYLGQPWSANEDSPFC